MFVFKALAIGSQIGSIVSALPKDRADEILDLLEDGIKATETKMDDKVGLPMLAAIRVVLDIPDNDTPV